MPHFPLPLPRCCRLSDGERQRCLINEKKKRKDERVTERLCESQRLIMIKQIQAVARRVKFIQLYFLQEENQLFDSTQSHRSGFYLHTVLFFSHSSTSKATQAHICD